MWCSVIAWTHVRVSCIRYGIIWSQKVQPLPALYLGLLRGSNDLIATAGGSLAWNSDANTTCLSMDSIFGLAFLAWTFCFVYLPVLIKLFVVHIAFKCIAWSSCLCVNRPIHGESANKTKLKVTASYTGTTANLDAMSAMTIWTISQHSTIGNH